MMGLSPMGSNDVPAVHPTRIQLPSVPANRSWRHWKPDCTPDQLITTESLRNAAAAVCATAGSTNAVLHLLAIAEEAGVEFELNEFDEISRRTPVIADLKPGGRIPGLRHVRGGWNRGAGPSPVRQPDC